MTPTTEEETTTARKLLDAGVITSRTALLLTLLGSDTGACQVGPLASKLGLSIPRVSMLGDTLVKMKLADRCVPASDLRKVTLALTSSGYTLARHQLAMLRAFSADAASVQPAIRAQLES